MLIAVCLADKAEMLHRFHIDLQILNLFEQMSLEWTAVFKNACIEEISA